MVRKTQVPAAATATTTSSRTSANANSSVSFLFLSVTVSILLVCVFPSSLTLGKSETKTFIKRQAQHQQQRLYTSHRYVGGGGGGAGQTPSPSPYLGSYQSDLNPAITYNYYTGDRLPQNRAHVHGQQRFGVGNVYSLFGHIPVENPGPQAPTMTQGQNSNNVLDPGYPQSRVLMPIPIQGNTQGFPAALNDYDDSPPVEQILGTDDGDLNFNTGPDGSGGNENFGVGISSSSLNPNPIGFQRPLPVRITEQVEPSSPALQPVRLVPLNVDAQSLTASGFSSGGAFVQQLLVSHPSLFKGVGIFHQTFYRCGGGGGLVEEFDFRCTNLPNPNFTTTEPRVPYDPLLALRDIGTYFAEGLIEDPRNLRDKRLYVYAGLQNPVFTIEMMMNIHKVLGPYLNPDLVKTRVQDANNLMPTNKYGRACGESADNNAYSGNCGLDGAYEAISFLLGPEVVKKPSQDQTYNPSSLYQFDQTEYFEGIGEPHFMANSGFIYVPANCASGQIKCLFHVYFHGCRSGGDYLGTNHVTRIGYLELAELNNIVMLFPQVSRTGNNDLGCWDSFGNTGELYATRRGSQIIIVRRMIERILGFGVEQFSSTIVRTRASSPSSSVLTSNFAPVRRDTNNSQRRYPGGRRRSNICKLSNDFATLYLCHSS